VQSLNHSRSPFGASGSSHPKRAVLDFYPTPPEAIRALLSVEQFDGSIWEPACRDGSISRELTAAGYEVVSTDISDHGFGASGIDFLHERSPSKLLLCPMPGLIVSVNVAQGQDVKAGETLAIVEAMKMENVLTAEQDVKVKKSNASSGDSLALDDVIMEFG
jgi:biotin carboxyl carrier protein